MNDDLIACFVPTMAGGGAQRVIVNLAIGLVKRGLRVDLVLAKATGPYLQEIPPEINVVDLGASRTLTAVPGLACYLKREQPAGLISAMNYANLVAILAKRFAGVQTKVVATIHNTFSAILASDTKISLKSRLSLKAILLLEKMFYPFAHAVVAVSDGVANDMVKLGILKSQDVKVVYNPVITPQLESKSKDKIDHKWLTEKDQPVLIGMGTLTAQKNFWNLLRAFKLVIERRPARLIILGQGRERKSLEALVAELGIQDCVDMPGFVDNPFSYLANADMFVLSSDWEGLPTVLIEALAVGTPLVSTDCPSGPQEILQGGRYGRLVPMRNPKALADAIVATLDEPRKPVDPAALAPFTLLAAADAYLKVLQT